MKKFVKFAVIIAFLTAFPAVALAQPTPAEEGLIPVRAFFEQQGGEVAWDADERVITIFIDGGYVFISPDSLNALSNNTPVVLEDGITLHQNRAYMQQSDLIALQLGFFGTEIVTFHLTEEARDLALYDFDFMVNVTLENSVWDNIIYRRLGIDFDAYVAQFRELIETMTPIEAMYLPEHLPIRGGDDPRDMAADYLSHLLFQQFIAPFGGIGHLAPRELMMYRILLSAFSIAYVDENDPAAGSAFLRNLIETYSHPMAVWFYGEYEVDFDAEPLDAFPIVPGNIVTEIITPGEVAYLGIRSFLSNKEYDDAIIFPFLQEIEDFDHLIIDIRGNIGGISSYFVAMIYARLLQEATASISFQFFASGSEAVRTANNLKAVLADVVDESMYSEVTRFEIIPSVDFVYEMGMTYFNSDDLARLSYVFIMEETVFPEFISAEDRVNFDGKIWLLVDRMSMSASAEAAILSMMTGFATVVGENTSGVMGAFHTYILLPNTGIIWRLDIGHFTDAYGRSLEEFGVTPQIRNREGMDALETVLAIISDEE
ncbi:MAG: S41 family peptidase [Defluviitaleaceae bacterium]|nr:S41 family peptidase [Defluviitaleaceae bacterium]